MGLHKPLDYPWWNGEGLVLYKSAAGNHGHREHTCGAVSHPDDVASQHPPYIWFLHLRLHFPDSLGWEGKSYFCHTETTRAVQSTKTQPLTSGLLVSYNKYTSRSSQRRGRDDLKKPKPMTVLWETRTRALGCLSENPFFSQPSVLKHPSWCQLCL